MTRKQQFWVLIFLSAATAFCQYIIQGTLAVGQDPGVFDPRFWAIDAALWGFRALVETWVVGYCFSTHGKNMGERFTLLFFEIVLLVLIVFTLGPAFESLGAQQTVYELLSASGFKSWAYAIAAYTSLMIAGAGAAYRIQPFDIEEEEPKAQKKKKVVAPKVANGTINGSAGLEEATPVILKAIEEAEDGRINQTALAEELDKSRQTIDNWLKVLQGRGAILRLSGRGRFALKEAPVEEMEMPTFGD